MMEKLYTGVKTHNFLDNDKTEDFKISVNNKFDADKFCMDIATQVDALKHEWKEKMILKDMGYCCEEEKLMQQINKESLELSLLQDYIENGNRVSYDSTLKGVDEFKQNSEKATPVLNTSTPPNPAQINSHTIMEQEIVQLFTNATEIVESFEVVVTPWYQEFKRRRLDVVTEEQQFYQSNQQESFKVSTDSFQTCWDLLQYEQV